MTIAVRGVVGTLMLAGALFLVFVGVASAECPAKCQNSSTVGGGASQCDPPGYTSAAQINADVARLRQARQQRNTALVRQLEAKLKQCKDGAEKCVGVATFSTAGGGTGSRSTCAPMPGMMGMGMMPMMMPKDMMMPMMGGMPMLPMLPMPMPKMDMPMMMGNDPCKPSFFGSFFDSQVPEHCKRGGVDPLEKAHTTPKDLSKEIKSLADVNDDPAATDTPKGPKTTTMPLTDFDDADVANDDEEAGLYFGPGGNANRNVGEGSFGFGTGSTFGAAGGDAGRNEGGVVSQVSQAVVEVVGNLIEGIAAGVAAIPDALADGLVTAAGAVEWLQAAAEALVAALAQLNPFN